MSEADKRRVIGFFAADGGQVLAHQNACVVAAAASLEGLMRSQTPRDKLGNALNMTVRKIRLEAILLGLASGGAYAFDEYAYELFYPLANRHGYLLEAEEFVQPEDGGLALVTIRC